MVIPPLYIMRNIIPQKKKKICEKNIESKNSAVKVYFLMNLLLYLSLQFMKVKKKEFLLKLTVLIIDLLNTIISADNKKDKAKQTLKLNLCC